MTEHDPRDDYDDQPQRERRTGDELVQWLGSAVSAFGTIQLILAASCLFAGTVWLFQVLLDPTLPRRDQVRGIAFFLIAVVGLGWNYLVIVGARDMRRYRRYRRAVLGTALSIIPIPLYFIGPFSFPFSVAALVVLLRRDVRARFGPTAGATMNTGRSEPSI